MTMMPHDVLSPARRNQFFVEWRVTTPAVSEAISALQQTLLGVEPSLQVLQSCAANNIHVTMNQLQLKSEAQVQTAMAVVKDFNENEFPKIAAGIKMQLQGFDDFDRRVLFVKVRSNTEGSDTLSEIYNCLDKKFTDAGLSPKEGSFNAHLTVCKAARGAKIPQKVFDALKAVGDEDVLSKAEQPLTELAFCVKRVQEEPTPPVLYNISLEGSAP